MVWIPLTFVELDRLLDHTEAEKKNFGLLADGAPLEQLTTCAPSSCLILATGSKGADPESPSTTPPTNEMLRVCLDDGELFFSCCTWLHKISLMEAHPPKCARH